jgi:transposase
MSPADVEPSVTSFTAWQFIAKQSMRGGEDVSERLDIVPAQFRVIATHRPKYACRSCEAGIIQAPAKPRLIEGGMPTEATIASVIVSKYADHLPLYRQSQIYARQGVDIDRSTLAFWVGKAAHELKPVHDALLAHLKRSSKLFMDETPVPVLDPGRGKTKKGYFWALARDDRAWNGPEPPGVVFTYALGLFGKYASEILQGFTGVLQVDGYAGYNRVLDLRDNQPIQLAYCWAHARRKLYELTHNNVAPIAEEGLKQIVALYRIEAQARGTSAQERLAIRQQKSAPKIAAFKTWLDHVRAQVSAKSPTGDALKYIAKYWDGLILFLGDGRIEMDSNAPFHRNYVSIAGSGRTHHPPNRPAKKERTLCWSRCRCSKLGHARVAHPDVQIEQDRTPQLPDGYPHSHRQWP